MKKVIIIVVLILLSAGAAWMIDEKPFSKAKEEIDIRILSEIEVQWSEVAKVHREHDLNSEEGGALFFATAINEIYPYLKDLNGYDKTLAFVQDIKNNTEKYSFYMFTKFNMGIIKIADKNSGFSINTLVNRTEYCLYDSFREDLDLTKGVLPDGTLLINPEKIARLIQQ